MATFSIATPLLAQNTPGPDITKIIWGFDGTVMRGRFCPLSLIVDNPTAKPWDGEIQAYRTEFGGRRVGAVLSRRIYLAPGTRRIVQFYPYIISDTARWSVKLGGKTTELTPVKPQGPARVALIGDGNLYRGGGAVKHFPERLFPPLSTATDSLGVVILDHVPDWDGPRRQAFLDWLRQGGMLHLMQTPQGGTPQFGADLNVLNEPSQQFYVGGGRVMRHPITLAQLSPLYVHENLDAAPSADNASEKLLEQLSSGPKQPGNPSPYGYNYDMPLSQWSFHAHIVNDLKRTVIPNHNWALIHLLSLAYIAVLFPGCFLIGREYRKTPLTFGLIVGSTLLFGAAFYQVGNRGYGEATSVHSVALARHIEGNRFDVMAWSTLFVTSGGYYRLTNSGTDRLYSAATDNEAVGGAITAGSRGSFVVDIPPFSSRVMTRKAIATIPAAGPVTLVANPDGGQEPAFQIPPQIAKHLQGAYVLIADKAASARLREGLLVLGGEKPIGELLDPEPNDAGYWHDSTQQGEPDLKSDQSLRQLILYSLSVVKDKQLRDFRVPPGFACVYLYAKQPAQGTLLTSDATEPTNAVKPARIGHQSGYILYEFDVPLTRSSLKQRATDH